MAEPPQGSNFGPFIQMVLERNRTSPDEPLRPPLSKENSRRRSEGEKPERRSAPRARGQADVMVLTMRGPVAGTLVDLSLTGCSIEADELPKLAINARIAILAHGLEMRAERRWVHGARSGWRFVYSETEQTRLSALLPRRAERFPHPFTTRA
jgi:hypothetical protein